MNRFWKGKKNSSGNNKPKKLYGHFKRLQDIYSNQGIKSQEFYNQTIAYVKRLLNKYLYQKQFNEDNINDCFIAIYERIEKHYNAEKGCLGTFIHTVVRNYCTKVNYKLVNHPVPISLDFEFINRDDLSNNHDDSDADVSDESSNKNIENDLDNVENYCESLKVEDTLDLIEYYFDLQKHYEGLTELTNKDINKINTLDAVRKDMLWNVWVQQA